MKTFPAILKLFMLLFIFQSLNSCHYYKATTQNTSNKNTKVSLTDSLAKTPRYFILRNGNTSYSMNNLVLSEDKKFASFIIDTVGNYHRKHATSGKENYKYEKKTLEDQVLNEVHFYINPDNSIPNKGEYVMDLDKIIKIEVIEKDKKKTTNSYVIASIGITLGALALAAIIIAATKSSCPFVSAYNGTDFTLQGEIYGGAIYPQLARHDYLPLDMKPLPDGNLQLKISNELKENQFTDMVELLEITHDSNTVVFADEHGSLSSIMAPVKPTFASINSGKDVSSFITKPGDNAILYMNDTSNSTNELILSFDNPNHHKNGKLLLSLKNSYFLDLLYGELAKGFGSYYVTYKEKQKAKPAAELIAWGKDQQIPLSVYAKSKNGWVKITDITTIGPVATRNIVIPCNLPGTNEPVTQIKLSAGFLFWEIDYAAMDYSENNSFTVKHMIPTSATDENNKDMLPVLLWEDGSYLSQPEIGNAATVTFKPGGTATGKVNSYILHSKGYYEHIRHFDNKPDMSFLKQFKKSNAFPKFGLQLYKKMNADQIKSLAK